ncbi:hypothetical protein [Mycolicibacterium farcinogenes]|uniref:Uncharacterized protein n=1 Tax=Mycolicibacterium farcinogenes TaxID=1802 RepID=A0ACD1FCC7_MYCFR|nr:hypothetical protein [Mycolicibacterium farcinogenes]QZH64724.1 hypothetical protein K6L26_22260 [Mycolicibacterium farcinogenes]
MKTDIVDSAEEFFLDSGSDQLEKIYGWARARHGAPWAVFFGVLLRVAAGVPPHVQPPPVIGDRASLNLLCAFVGPSGAGKGNATKIARAAWPTDVLELPPGTGQGIAEAFVKRNPEDENSPVIFDIPEIDTMAGLSSARGSILLPTIKSLAMGEQLGQANATKDARRIVPEHTYRACMSVGAQPGHTDVIFNDASGGTPQRFLWAPVTDPNMPGGRFPMPDPLVTDMPNWTPRNDGVVEFVYSVPEIEDTIIENHLARQRGDGDALDGHAILTRCKVAALLAIMHGRLEVTEWDWRMSETVMAVSNDTRAGLERDNAEIERRRIENQGREKAFRVDGFEAGRLESVMRAILEKLRKSGEMPGSELRTSINSANRKWFDQAISQLAEDGRIVVTRAGSGFRYRLTDSRQGGDPRQGGLMQVSGDGDLRQGGSVDAPISLENRRSQKNHAKKVSCRAWLEEYLAELVNQGQTTADPFAVRDAGVAAGYNRNQLHNAGSTLGLTGSVWSLTA